MRLPEILELELTKLMDNFLTNPPLEMKELQFTIAVTSLELCSSVLNTIGHNKLFRINAPRYWGKS